MSSNQTHNQPHDPLPDPWVNVAKPGKPPRYMIRDTYAVGWAMAILFPITFGLMLAQAMSTPSTPWPSVRDLPNREKTHLSIVIMSCRVAPDMANEAAMENVAALHVSQPQRPYEVSKWKGRILRERPSMKQEISRFLDERQQAEHFHSTECYLYPNKVSCSLMRNILNYEAFAYSFTYKDTEQHTYEATGDPENELVLVLVEESKPLQFSHWPTQPRYLPWSVECHHQAMQLSKFAGNPLVGGKMVTLEHFCGQGTATESQVVPQFWTRFAQDRCPNLGILTLGWSAESAFGGVAQVQVTVAVQDRLPPKLIATSPLAEICIVDQGQVGLFKKVCPAWFADAWVRQKMFKDECDSSDELDLQFGWRQTCVCADNTAVASLENLDRSKCNCELQDGEAFPPTTTYPYTPPTRHFPLKWEDPDGPKGANPFFRQDNEQCDTTPAGLTVRYGGVRVFDLCGNLAIEQPTLTIYFVAQKSACPYTAAQVPFDYIVAK